LNSFWVGQDGGAAILLFKIDDGAGVGFGTGFGFGTLNGKKLLVEKDATQATSGRFPGLAVVVGQGRDGKMTAAGNLIKALLTAAVCGGGTETGSGQSAKLDLNFFILMLPSRATIGVDTFVGKVVPPAIVPLPTSAVGFRPRCIIGPNPIQFKSVFRRISESDNCAGVSAGVGHVLCGQLLAYFVKGRTASKGGGLKPCICFRRL